MAVATRAQKSRTDEVVERIAVLLEADGMPRVAGRLFGLLLLSSEPQSLDALASKLGVSKASITVARAACATEHDVVCARLENMERAYNHLIEVTERALEDSRTHRSTTPSPLKAR